MRLAEAFVRANGYTDAPPTNEFRDPESFERGPEKIDGTGKILESRAWGFQRGSRSDLDQGWSVIFQIKQKPAFKTKPNEAAYGKVVQMDRSGGLLLVLHGVVVAYDTPEFRGYTKRTDLATLTPKK